MDTTEALNEACRLYEIWRHLPISDCMEQVELHMESDGWTDREIGMACDDLFDMVWDREI